MGCWKLFGIFWVVHMLLCGDFSCSYICESALDGGEEIVVGLRIESLYERVREWENIEGNQKTNCRIMNCLLNKCVEWIIYVSVF